MLPSTLLQKKTFTKWANSKLATLDEPQYLIQDLESDLRDGHRLLALVRVLVKKTNMATTTLVPEKHHQRIHHIINVGKALKCIELCTRMPLPNIGSEDIVDGNLKLTLGLIWLLILRFQITQIADLNIASKAGTAHDVTSDDELKMVSATQDAMPQKLEEVQLQQQSLQKEQLQQPPQQQKLQLQEPQQLEQQQQPQLRQQEQVQLQQEQERQQDEQQAHLQLQQQQEQRQQQEQQQQQEKKLQQQKLQQQQKQKQQESTKFVQSTSRTQKTERKVQQTKTVDVQVQLLQWTKDRLSKIQPKATLPTNFGKAWQDGQHFCLLVHGYAPTHLRLSQVRPLNDNKEDWKFNLDLAFGVAEHHLRIPTLLDPEDLVHYADEKSIMTYLSGFCELPAPPTAPPEPVQEEVKSAEVQLSIDTKDSSQVQAETTKPASPAMDSGLNATPPAVNAPATFQGEPQPAAPVPQSGAQPAAQALPSAAQPASPKRLSFFSRVISGPSSPISTLTSYAASFVLPKSPVTTETPTQSTDSAPSSPSKGTLSDAGMTRLAPDSASPVVHTAPAPTPVPDLSLSQTASSASLNPSLPRKPSFTESIASYVAIFSPSRQASILEDTPAAQEAVPEPAPKPVPKPAPKEALNASASASSWSGYFSSFLLSRPPAEPAVKELETNPTNQDERTAGARGILSGETNVGATEISQTQSNVTGSHAREILLDTQIEEQSQRDEKSSAATKVESVQTSRNEHGVVVTTITTVQTTTTTVSQNQEYASRTEVLEVHSSSQESQIHGGEMHTTQMVTESSAVDKGMNVTTMMGVQVGAEGIKSETRETSTSSQLRTGTTYQQISRIERDGTATATASNRSEQGVVVSSMTQEETDVRKRKTFQIQESVSESQLRGLATFSQTTQIQSEESSATFRRSESAHSEQRTIAESAMTVQASGEATKVLQTTDYGSQSHLHGLVASSHTTRIQSEESKVTVRRSESVQSEERTTSTNSKSVQASGETIKGLQTLESESQSQLHSRLTPSKATQIQGDEVSATVHRYKGSESAQTTVVTSTMVTEGRLEEVKVSKQSETTSSSLSHKEFTYQQPMRQGVESSAGDNEGGSGQSAQGIALKSSMAADSYKDMENAFLDQDVVSQSHLHQALVTSQASRIDNSQGHEAITIVGSSQIRERTKTMTEGQSTVVESGTTVEADKDQTRGSKHQAAKVATQDYPGHSHPSVDQQAVGLNAAREMAESHQIGQAQRGTDEMSMLRSVAGKQDRKAPEVYENVSISQLREGFVQPQLPHKQADTFPTMGYDESHLPGRKVEEQRASRSIVGKAEEHGQSAAKDREGEPSLESPKILSPSQPSQFSEEQKLIPIGDGYGRKDQTEPQMDNKSMLAAQAITEGMKGDPNQQNASRPKMHEGLILPQASPLKGDESSTTEYETESGRMQQNRQRMGSKSMAAGGADKKAATAVQNEDASQSQLGGFILSNTQASQPQNDEVSAAISRDSAGHLEQVIAAVKNLESDQQGIGARQTSAVPVKVDKDRTRASADRELLPSTQFHETSPNQKAPFQAVEVKANISEVGSGQFNQTALGMGSSRATVAGENIKDKDGSKLQEQVSLHPLHPGLAHPLVSVKRDVTNDKIDYLKWGQIDQSKPGTALESQMANQPGDETKVRSLKEPNDSLQRRDVLSPTQASQNDGDKSNAIVGKNESSQVEQSDKGINFAHTSGIAQDRDAKKVPKDQNRTRPGASVREFGENKNAPEVDSRQSDNEEQNKAVMDIKVADSDKKKGKFHENQESPTSTQLREGLVRPQVAVKRGADVTAEKRPSYPGDQMQPGMDFQDSATPSKDKNGVEKPTNLERGSLIQLPEGLPRPQVAAKREGTDVAAEKRPSYQGDQIQPGIDFQDSATPSKDKNGEEKPTSRERGPSVQLPEGVPRSLVVFQRDEGDATAQKPPSYQDDQKQPEGQFSTSSIGVEERKDEEKPTNRERGTSTQLREGLAHSSVAIQRDGVDATAQKGPAYRGDQLNLGMQSENSALIAGNGLDEKTPTNRKPGTSIQLREGYSGPQQALQRDERDMTTQLPPSYQGYLLQPGIHFTATSVGNEDKKIEEKPIFPEGTSSIHLRDNVPHYQVSVEKAASDAAHQKRPSYQDDQMPSGGQVAPSSIEAEVKKGGETPTNRERGPSIQLRVGLPPSQVTVVQRDGTDESRQKRPSYQGDQLQPGVQLESSVMVAGDNRNQEIPTNRERGASIKLREGLAGPQVALQPDGPYVAHQKRTSYQGDQMRSEGRSVTSLIGTENKKGEEKPPNREAGASIQLREGLTRPQVFIQRDGGDVTAQRGPSHHGAQMQLGMQFEGSSTVAGGIMDEETPSNRKRGPSIQLREGLAHPQVSAQRDGADATPQKDLSHRGGQMQPGVQFEGSSTVAGDDKDEETPMNQERGSSIKLREGLPRTHVAVQRDGVDATALKGPLYQADQMQPEGQSTTSSIGTEDRKGDEAAASRKRAASTQLPKGLALPQVHVNRDGADSIRQKRPSYQGGQPQPGMGFAACSSVDNENTKGDETPANRERAASIQLPDGHSRPQVELQRDGGDAPAQKRPSYQVNQLQSVGQVSTSSAGTEDIKNEETPTNRERGSSMQLRVALPPSQVTAVQRDGTDATRQKRPSYQGDQMQSRPQFPNSSIGAEDKKGEEEPTNRELSSSIQLHDGVARPQVSIPRDEADAHLQKGPSYQMQPGMQFEVSAMVAEDNREEEILTNCERGSSVQLREGLPHSQVVFQRDEDVTAQMHSSYQGDQMQAGGKFFTSSVGTEGKKGKGTPASREHASSIRDGLPRSPATAVQRDGTDATYQKQPSYEGDQMQPVGQFPTSSVGTEGKKVEETPASRERSASIQLRENLPRSPATAVQRDGTDATYQKQPSYEGDQMQPGGQFSTSTVGTEEKKAEEKPTNSDRAASIQLRAGIPYSQVSRAVGANIAVDKPEPRHSYQKQREIGEEKKSTAVEDHSEIKTPKTRDIITPSQMSDSLAHLQKPTINQTNLAVKEGGSNQSKQPIDTESIVGLQENIEGTKPYKNQDMLSSSDARKDPQVKLMGPDTNEKVTPVQSVRKESRLGFGNIMSMLQAGIKGLTASRNEDNVSPSQLRGDSTYPQASVKSDKATTESTDSTPGRVDQNDQDLGGQGVTSVEGDKSRSSERKNQEKESLQFGWDLAEHPQVSRQPDAQGNTDESIQLRQEEQGVDVERTMADELQEGQKIFKNQETASPAQLREIRDPSEEPLRKGKKSKAKGSQDEFGERNQRNEKIEARSIIADEADKDGSNLSNNQKKTSLSQLDNIPFQPSTHPEAKPAQEDISVSQLGQGLGVRPSTMSSAGNEKVRNVSNNQATTLSQLGGFIPPSQVSSDKGDEAASASRQPKSDPTSSKEQRRDSESSMDVKAGKKNLKASKDEVGPSTQLHRALAPSQGSPFKEVESASSTHQHEPGPSDGNDKPSDSESSRDVKAGKKKLKASKGQEDAASQLRGVLAPSQGSPYKRAESAEAARQHESGPSDSNEQLCEPEGSRGVKGGKKKPKVPKGKKSSSSQLHDVLAPAQVSLQSQVESSETARQHESGKSDSNEQLSGPERSKGAKAGKKKPKALKDQGGGASQLRGGLVPSQVTTYDGVETDSGTHQDQPTESHVRDLRFDSDSGRDVAEKERPNSIKDQDSDSQLCDVLAPSNESLDTRDATTTALSRQREPSQSDVKDQRLESNSDKNVKAGKKRPKPRKEQEDTFQLRDRAIPSEPTPSSEAEAVSAARGCNPSQSSSNDQQMDSGGSRKAKSGKRKSKASKGQGASFQSSRDIAAVLSSAPKGVEASSAAHQHDPRQLDAKEEQIGSDSSMDIEMDKQNSMLNERDTSSQSRSLHVPSQVDLLSEHKKAPAARQYEPGNPKSKESRLSLGGSRDIKPRKKSQETFKDQKDAASQMRGIVGPSQASTQGDEAASAARQPESGQTVSKQHRMGLESSWDVDLDKAPSVVSDDQIGVSSQMLGVASLSQASAQGDEAASAVRQPESGQTISKQHRMGLESSWDVDLNKGPLNVSNDQMDASSQMRGVVGPSQASAQRDEAASAGRQPDSKKHQMGEGSSRDVDLDMGPLNVSNDQKGASSQMRGVVGPSQASAQRDEEASTARQHEPGQPDSKKHRMDLETSRDVNADKKRPKVSNDQDDASSQGRNVLAPSQASAQGGEAASAARQHEPGLSASQKRETGLESIRDAKADKKKAKVSNVHEAAFSQFPEDLAYLQAPLQGTEQNILDSNEVEFGQAKKSAGTGPTMHVRADLEGVEATKKEETAPVSNLKKGLDELQAIPKGQQADTSMPRNSQSGIGEIPQVVHARQSQKSLAKEADVANISTEPGYTENTPKTGMLRIPGESDGSESVPKRASMTPPIPLALNQTDKNLAQEDISQIQNRDLGYPGALPLGTTHRGMGDPMDGIDAALLKIEAIHGESEASGTAQNEKIRIQMGRVLPSEKTPSKKRSSSMQVGSAAMPAQTEGRTREQAFAPERNDLQRNVPTDVQGTEHQLMDSIQGENFKQQNPRAFKSMDLLLESMKKEDDGFDTNKIASREGVQSNIHRSSIEKQTTRLEAETLHPEQLREVHIEPSRTPYATAIQERNANTLGALQKNNQPVLRETRSHLEDTRQAQGLPKVTLPLPIKPLELRRNVENERQARAKLLSFLEKMNLKLLDSQGMGYVDEYLSDTIPEENAYLGKTGDSPLALVKTTRSYYSLVTQGTQTQIFGLSTFASSGFIESGGLSFSEGGQPSVPNEMIVHSSSALERATHSNILASISDKGMDSTSSKANEFIFQQRGISPSSFISLGGTSIASSSRSLSRASSSTAATSMRLKDTQKRGQVTLATFSETVQSPLLTNSTSMVSPFGRLSPDSTEEITSEKILVLAIQHLSKQVQLLPSNPASYQVRIELFHHYEIQYLLLVTRAEELGLVSSIIIENNTLTRRPEGEVGTLLYELQLKLKKESKVLSYERRVHIVIGFGLVIFMTWAFFYLPILDVDAKNDDQCHWN